jgi:hypothetical protein
MRGLGNEQASYMAGWALSCVAALSTILLVWHLHA